MNTIRSYAQAATFAALGILAASLNAVATNPPLSQPNPDVAKPGKVYAVLKQVDGGTILGGEFSSVNGQPRLNLARRRSDGHLDPAWRADVAGTVHALATDASGAIYVGGQFTSVQGQLRSSIARISPTGVLDATWHPAINMEDGFGLVNAIAIDTLSSAIYIAGEFYDVNGIPRSHLAKLATDDTGSLDSKWNPSASSRTLSLAVATDGSVFVGGQFDSIGGSSRLNLAKLLPNSGSADPSWSADADGVVHALALDSSGRLYAGGDFDQVGGQSRPNIARLLASGLPDPEWNAYIGGQGSPFVLALDLSQDDELYVGGAFSYPRDNVIKFDVNGYLDSTWQAFTNEKVAAIDASVSETISAGGYFSTANDELRLGFAEFDENGSTTLATDAELPGKVYAIGVQANGGTIVGGSFSKGGGMPRSNLLRILPTGEVDPDWSPSPDDTVEHVVVTGDDTVYAAGQFSRVDGFIQWGLAKFTGANGSLVTNWGGVAGGDIVAMTLGNDGNLYIGGTFTGVESVFRPHLARLLPQDGLDETWNPPNDRYVGALASTSAGSIDVSYYSYSFPTYSGNIKRISTIDGSTLRVWALDYPASFLYSNLGMLYAYGGFQTIDGTPRSGLVRFLPDGNVDESWHTPALLLYAICIDHNENVFVVRSVSGDEHEILKISYEDGSLDSSWAHSATSSNPVEYFRTNALSVALDNSILVGGGFDHVDGYRRSGFVALRDADSIFVDHFEPTIP
ncbi:MAG: hypothetical protein EYC71_12865 [Gammaproteobacteria bacterium]|nr:MAG: hypothetical protein EYC71_12865 [Gammaproteobacteria bacterium]